jgi:hypothetical protein
MKKTVPALVGKRRARIGRFMRRRITGKKFREDPGFWLLVARHVGPVTIVDDRGEVRATLSVPGPR